MILIWLDVKRVTFKMDKSHMNHSLLLIHPFEEQKRIYRGVKIQRADDRKVKVQIYDVHSE